MISGVMVDLMAARETAYRSAFVKRPAEWGRAAPPDPARDIVARDPGELAQRPGA